MTGKAEEIVELLSPTVAALGLELLGAEFAQSGGSAMLRLYIDVEGRHVAIEDCEAVSREVSAVLDVNDDGLARAEPLLARCFQAVMADVGAKATHA